jgi:tetrahydromethanopterin S-methyltransferase subunit G
MQFYRTRLLMLIRSRSLSGEKRVEFRSGELVQRYSTTIPRNVGRE